MSLNKVPTLYSRSLKTSYSAQTSEAPSFKVQSLITRLKRHKSGKGEKKGQEKGGQVKIPNKRTLYKRSSLSSILFYICPSNLPHILMSSCPGHRLLVLFLLPVHLLSFWQRRKEKETEDSESEDRASRQDRSPIIGYRSYCFAPGCGI